MYYQVFSTAFSVGDTVRGCNPHHWTYNRVGQVVEAGFTWTVVNFDEFACRVQCLTDNLERT